MRSMTKKLDILVFVNSYVLNGVIWICISNPRTQTALTWDSDRSGAQHSRTQTTGSLVLVISQRSKFNDLDQR